MNLILLTLFLALLSWLMAGFWMDEIKFSWRKVPAAELLNRWLQSWQLLGSQGGALSQLGVIPQYKFFSRLAEEGLRQARTFGSFPKELIWEWRDGVAREKAFDQRWQGIRVSAWLQFAMFTAITWVLVYMTGDLVGAIPHVVYVVMLIIQAVGFALFSPFIKFMIKRRLNGFAELLESLYVMRTLSAAALPTSKVISEAKLERIVTIKTLILQPLIERVQELALLYQKQGGALGREAQILLQECWFLREEGMTKLTKTAEGLKLVFLLCFFAGPYFLFLSVLIFQVLQTN